MRLAPGAWVRVALALTAIGWGANTFAPMVSVYRRVNGFSESLATFAFASYVVGLVPGLLGAAWLSQHIGKRRVMRPALVISLLATALFLAGPGHTAAILGGRVLAGLATGVAMGPGTAWIKELCADAPVGTGARRATVALSAGFAGGPLAGGLLAHLGVHPRLLPFLPHVVLGTIALLVAWGSPEVDATDHPTPSIGRVAEALSHPWFWTRVVPSAPWVFGAVSMSFLYIAPRTAAALDPALAIGLAAGLTLGTGVLVQPSVRRFEGRHPGRTPQLGLLLLALGLLVGVLATGVRQPALLLLTAPLLGSAYGALMVGGLTQVEAHVPLFLLAPAASAFYCLTYIGFFAPFVVSLLPAPPPAAVLLVGAGVAVVTALLVRPRRTRA